MAMKYMNKDDKVTPGPSDYKFDPINSLKRETRVTIGKQRRESCLESK